MEITTENNKNDCSVLHGENKKDLVTSLCFGDLKIVQSSYYEESDEHKVKESEESVRNSGFREKDTTEKDSDKYFSDDDVVDDEVGYDISFSTDDDYDDFDYQETSLEEEEEEEEEEAAEENTHFP